MGKKFVILGIVFALFFSVFAVSYVSAEERATCGLDADIVNQDPEPAIVGDYVEIVFQVRGLGSCDNGAIANLVLDYPFSLDEEDSFRLMKSNTYAGYGYNSNWNIPYKLRIDPDAIEGEYEIELRYVGRGIGFNMDGYYVKRFNITIEDGRTDFEVHIDEHKIEDRNLVFQVLNTGNQDIEALTLEIPPQDSIVVKGSNRNIVGDLDSNEYTTADFEAIPSEGKINLILYYTDSTNERRTIGKTVVYDPSYFIDSIENMGPDRTNIYIIGGLIVLVAGFFIYRKRKSNKNNKKRRKFKI